MNTEEFTQIPDMDIIKDKTKVSEVLDQYNAYIIHGIHPNFTPKWNTTLKEGTEWRNKLEIVIKQQPTLSCSSIKKGESWRNLWSRMGVLLVGGEIEDAYSTDAASRIIDSNKRQVNLDKRFQSSILQAINRSGPKYGVTGKEYNEFIISKPLVGGFYLCLEDTSPYGRNDLVPFEEIVKELSEREIPLFVMLRGVLYQLAGKEVDATTLEKIYADEKKLGVDKTTRNMLKDGWKVIQPQDLSIMNRKDIKIQP